MSKSMTMHGNSLVETWNVRSFNLRNQQILTQLSMAHDATRRGHLRARRCIPFRLLASQHVATSSQANSSHHGNLLCKIRFIGLIAGPWNGPESSVALLQCLRTMRVQRSSFLSKHIGSASMTARISCSSAAISAHHAGSAVILPIQAHWQCKYNGESLYEWLRSAYEVESHGL